MGIRDQLKSKNRQLKNEQEVAHGETQVAHKEALPKPARDAKGRLLPGQSLNPGGRRLGASGIAAAILERARGWQTLEDAVDGLLDLSDSERVQVIFKLIDRAHGRAPETVKLEGHVGTTTVQWSEATLRVLLEDRRRQLEAAAEEQGQVVEGGVISALPAGGEEDDTL